MRGFNSDAITRPLTGLFRKTGRSGRKADNGDSHEPTIAAPPTNVPNMARISATIESVQMNEDHVSQQDGNSETGSKLTLSDGVVYGKPTHPLTRYFKVGDIDISMLARRFPTEKSRDEDVSWTAQSLLGNLETRIKKERFEAKDQGREPRSRNNRDMKVPF